MALYSTLEPRPPLNESLYLPNRNDVAFWMQQTRIGDAAALKCHILEVAKRAYELYGYPCIRLFDFVHTNIAHLPTYERVMRLAHERPDALLLDIGCCFGHDTRKVVADGWPMGNIIASDLRRGFWDIGHELFRSSPETFPVAFLEGDALDPGMIAPHGPLYASPDTPRPVLDSLTSLTPLQGHLSVVNASCLFHLFTEVQQHTLAHRLGSLLAPHAGATIFGTQATLLQTGTLQDIRGTSIHDVFCFSPQDWAAVWDGGVFRKGTVRVEVETVLRERPDIAVVTSEPYYMLLWSVTRL